jgi:hypothetical protein
VLARLQKTATHWTSPLAVCEAAIAAAWPLTSDWGAGLNKDRMGQGAAEGRSVIEAGPKKRLARRGRVGGFDRRIIDAAGRQHLRA